MKVIHNDAAGALFLFAGVPGACFMGRRAYPELPLRIRPSTGE
jgi:hypothetical protein